MREKILFNKDWLFHKGDIDIEVPKQKGAIYMHSKTERAKWGPASKDYFAEFDAFAENVAYTSDAWIKVDLPHDYIIEQKPDKDENNTLGYFKYTNCWYRKKFTIPEADASKRITLLFDGVATHCTVYLNGCLMKRNFSGYSSFEVDITDVIRFNEENILAVYVNTQDPEGWWYEGGGIYRHVWLIKTDTVCVDLWGLYGMPRKTNEDNWSVPACVTVLNTEYEDCDVKLKCSVTDKHGNTVATSSATAHIPLRSSIDINAPMTVCNPVLWDTDNPEMYTIKADVYTNGILRDTYTDRIGFRTFDANPDKGLFLNGKHIDIKGVCCHQDFGLTGKAVPDNILRHKIQLIKEMGANGFRCSHYTHPTATMDALDDMGFIVMAEARWFESTDDALTQLEMLVKRDRNRPSVCFWSVGNEEPYHMTKQGRRICKSMIARIKQLDDSRMAMTAFSHSPEEETVFDALDVIGVNYNLEKYDYIHEKYPDKALFASECCATGTTRGWYYSDCPERGYLEAYDKDTNTWFRGRENTWKFFNERPWIMGGYQWIAFDHRGETVWPRLSSQSGAMDMFLQKKDAFYQNQAMWIDNRPVIHIMPHWNFAGLEGESIRVRVYSNCPKVELFLNGVSIGKVLLAKFDSAEWNVSYKTGMLEAKGYDKDGNEICSEIIETTGKPVALKLRSENIVTANGQDIALVTCYCVDDKGRFVPTATPTVRFNCNSLGRIVGTGSDISDHTPVPSPIRKMRAGLISVAVLVGETSGQLKVYAECDELDSAVVTINI